MRRAGGVLLFLLFLTSSTLAGRAGADSWRFPDGGGAGGPLSIAAVHGGHIRGGPTVTIVFDRPIDPAAMAPRDFVVVDLEMDGKGKSEAWVYFFGVRGKLRTYVYYPKYDYGTEDAAIFRRLNARTIRLNAPVATDAKGVYFAVGSYSRTGCAKPCWDVVPNGGYLIHDWTPRCRRPFRPPSGRWATPPRSPGAAATPAFPASTRRC